MSRNGAPTSRACICGGNNENCRFCGGLGTIPDRLANALTKRITRAAKHGPPPPASPILPSRSTSPEQGPSALEEHLRKKQESLAWWQSKVAKLGRNAPEHRTKSPECATSPIDSVLCSKPLMPPPAQQDVTAPNIPDRVANLNTRPRTDAPLVICRVCKVKVRADRIDRHVIKVHGTVAARAIAIDGTKKSSPKPIRSLGRNPDVPPELMRYKPEDGEVESPPWANNLDATKNCGYPAREEGRYGSYPSHDGFDDESEP